MKLSLPSFGKISSSSSRASKTRITPQRRKKIILSYLPDWLMTIVLVLIFFLLDEIPGFRRDFSLNDTSLQHPFAEHERIPNKALIILAVLAPFLLNLVVNFLTVRSWWDAHTSTLGLLLGLGTTGSITQFVKVTVGRPRPDIISRCIPAPGSADPLWGLSTYHICTQTNEKVLKDGFRSFFSGHSSLSFAGLGFLGFYLAGKLHLFDQKGHAGKTWLCLTPFAAAALVAISRAMDYRHHWHDILIGSLVGTILSYFSYRQYYPNLASPYSHRPYSPRIAREEPEHAEGMYLPRTQQDVDGHNHTAHNHSAHNHPLDGRDGRTHGHEGRTQSRRGTSDTDLTRRDGDGDSSEGYEMAPPGAGATRSLSDNKLGSGPMQERPGVDRVYSQVGGGSGEEVAPVPAPGYTQPSAPGYAAQGAPAPGYPFENGIAPAPRRADSNFVNPAQEGAGFGAGRI